MELPSDDDGMSAPMLIPAAKPKAAVKKRARGKKTTKAIAESKPSKVLAKGSRQSPRQPANASSSLFVSAPRLPDPDIGLPPDDDGDVDFVTSGSISKPHAPVVSKARGKPKKTKDTITAVSKGRGDEGDTFPWTHETLKIAASEIPSVISMPYEDLKAMLANPRPLNSCSERCTIWEIYSVPRLGPRVRELGGSSRSYDLRHFWDLQMDSYRRLLLSDCSQLRPFYLSLSPPCTFLCQLMSSNWSRMKSAKKYISLADACSHIDLCMWLAKFQHESGAYFGFEHPQGSLAWSRDSVRHIMEMEGIYFLLFDQCMYGLVSKETRTPLRKRTGFLTNCKEIFDSMNNHLCDKSHPHQKIEGCEGGMRRSEWAQHYPDAMVDSLVKAVLKCERRWRPWVLSVHPVQIPT